MFIRWNGAIMILWLAFVKVVWSMERRVQGLDPVDL